MISLAEKILDPLPLERFFDAHEVGGRIGSATLVNASLLRPMVLRMVEDPSPWWSSPEAMIPPDPRMFFEWHGRSAFLMEEDPEGIDLTMVVTDDQDRLMSLSRGVVPHDAKPEIIEWVEARALLYLWAGLKQICQ